MPKEGSAFHPPIRHSVSPGMGGAWGHLKVSRTALMAPRRTARLPCSRQCHLLGRRRESCARWAGGRGGDRTQQG